MVKYSIGQHVEVHTDGDWWNAEILDYVNKKYLIHFEGGTDDENLWLPGNSSRMRLPQGEAGEQEEEDGGEVFQWEEPEIDLVTIPGRTSSGGSASAKSKGKKTPSAEAGAKGGKTPGGKGDGGAGTPRGTAEGRASKYEILPDGWTRVPKGNTKGKWVYVSPQGLEFSNHKAAMEYMEANPAPKKAKSPKQDPASLKDAVKAFKEGGGTKAQLEGKAGKEGDGLKAGKEGKGTKEGKKKDRQGGGGKEGKPTGEKKRKNQDDEAMIMDDEELGIDEVEVVTGKHGGAFDKPWRTFDHGYLYNDIFDDVRKWLLGVGCFTEEDPRNSNSALARIADIVQHSQFLHLGKDALPQKQAKLLRLPQKTFLDKRPNGGLCLLLMETLKYMQVQGYSVPGFEKTMFRGVDEPEFRHLQLFVSIHERLQGSNLLPAPIIMFSTQLLASMTPAQQNDLKSVVAKVKGSVTKNPDLATHVLVPDTADMAYEDDAVYCRTLRVKSGNKKRPALAYVHWWFMPDSYDEWLLQEAIQGEPEPPYKPPKQHSVCVRWLRDSALFNEWMNEEDYLPGDSSGGTGGKVQPWTPDEDNFLMGQIKTGVKKMALLLERLPGRTQMAINARWRKQKAFVDPSDIAQVSKKRKKEDGGMVSPRFPKSNKMDGTPGKGKASKGSAAPVQEKKKAERKVKPRTLTAQNECWDDDADLAASYEAEPITWDLPDLDQVMQEDGNFDGEAEEEEAIEVEEQREKPPGPPLVLPHTISWFSLEDVHECEKTQAPEYFSGQHPCKTPEVYTQHRRLIVQLWCYRLAQWAVEAGLDANKRNWDLSNLEAPKVTVSECLHYTQGNAGDTVRVFQAMQDLKIINGDCFCLQEEEEKRPGEVWEGTGSLLMRAYRKHGTNWQAVADEIRMSNKDLCVLSFVAQPLHRTTLRLPAGRLPASSLVPIWHGKKDKDDLALRSSVSLLQAGIGPAAAAAAASVCIEEEAKARRREVQEGAEGTGSASAATTVATDEQLQLAACRGVMLAGVSARAKVLAHRQNLEMRQCVVNMVDLRLLKIANKATQLLHQKKESVLAQLSALDVPKGHHKDDH